jgi:CelD/BcsL family acetyltransferase involved in cellulose biosynthesis
VAGRSFGEYLASRPGPLRTTLKRKAKKVEIELFNEFNDLAWQSYEEIYDQSWKPAEGNPKLLKRFARAEGAAGRIRLAVASHDGKAIAAQFWTVESGTAFIHKLAHRQNAQSLSPGTSLTAALMEQVIDRDRVTLIDFGTGDDPYKRDWMEDVRSRFQVDCFNRRSLVAWPHIAKGAIGRLASGFRAG